MPTARKYKTVKCGLTKGAANKIKKSMHSSGKTARLRKVKGGYCVESAGMRRRRKKKRA